MQPLLSYPVFEADQVLSNGHLNNLLNYLEQQERLTRIKLIGRGIVCGLEIQSSASEITLSKGCGLTSQGYLIQLCDTSYSFYASYSPPALPSDLTFLTQCGTENRNKVPFYQQKDILELIPSDDKQSDGKKPLNTLNLQDYAIVLFLEAEQIDLKNCDTQDCNDKGSKMEFVLRVLLVHKKFLESSNKIGFNSILLKRYNVPVQELKTSEDILKGFLNITDDVTLTHMSENLIRCWDRFAVQLGLPEENPIKDLNLISFKKKFSTSSIQRIYLQYFYDFIHDLFKAYLEFRSKIREAYGACCPEEMEFPLHLTLGMAHEDTRLGKNNSYRNYFEPSPILGGQSKSLEEAASLLERLVAMIQAFMGDKLSANESILITPNYLGPEPISLRSIPYYYDWKTINPKWYFSKNFNGNERYNLGYRAAKQAGAPEPVKNPLLYDIERYNAFRIEGHLGKNYRTALTDIIQQKNKFNLPFEVLALNAIDLSAILNGKEIKCHIEDLSSDYRVMITGIVCQLQQILAYVGNLRPKRTTDPTLSMAAVNFTRDFYISKNLVDMRKVIKSDLSNNQPLSISNEDIIKNLALRDVEEGEKLADFVAKDVSAFIVNDKAFFDYIIKQPDLLLIFLQQLAEIVKYLLAYDLDKFDAEAYNKLWTPYSKTVVSLIKEAANSENEEIKRYFSSSNTELLFKCANEKLFALKDEYLKRIEEYHAATIFSEYFKKHPGMEHKAGVPKGGTFILVYNGATDLVLTLPDLTFNRELLAGLSIATPSPRLTNNPPTSVRSSLASEVISRTDEALNVKSLNRTEFEFASELIKKLNLGDAAKNVLDALNLKDREIREQATPIAKGTVIADFYLPYLCCSECPPIAYIIPEEEPVNIGPVADAGQDQTFTLGPNQPISFTLDGTASKDEDGTITAFAWSQISGPQTTLKTPNKPKASGEIKTVGEYVFELTVTDDKGTSSKDSVKITIIEPENNGPIANAGRDQTFTIAPNQPLSVTLDGSDSKDQGGTITAFAWSQISGNPVTLKTPNKPKTEVEFSADGEYEFELTVTDDKGASNKDSVKVTVISPRNNPPVAEAGTDISITIRNPNSPGTIILDGSNSRDPENEALTFKWSLASGPVTPTITKPNQAKTEVTGLLEGEYKFMLEVTDNAGSSNSDTVIVKVNVLPVDTRTKTCGPLPDVLEAFAAFDKTQPDDNFKRFQEAFGPYAEVKEFFKSMSTISSSNVSKQTDFFAGAFGTAGLISKLSGWLEKLQNLIVEVKEIRAFAFQLYQILSTLVSNIVCIQNEDYDIAKIPMDKVFDVIEAHAKNWAELKASGAFGRIETAAIAKIEAVFTSASEQTRNNGEASAKPKYLRRLKIIEGII
ncbi:PKD domain-containing protein [uncultured Algoriphagus sp.]|uniref:PKD domain-containing protein n=1 Tax=uncultured Algoriphagus sp. TaxID=417365 RepID=UPI0030EB35A9|tara:strand:+ start:34878 stop:38969 length:4092 start_codon:yes stop_codon:yes gene_type:complete